MTTHAQQKTQTIWSRIRSRLLMLSPTDTVKYFRENIACGDYAQVVQPHQRFEGLVLNVRTFIHGQKEVFIQSNDSSFSGWVPIDQVLPPLFHSA